MPQLSCRKVIGNLKFHSYGYKLPTKWQPGPADDVGERPSPRLVPPWFSPAGASQQHQNSCDQIGAAFKELHDTLIDAVVFAHDLWRLQAQFKNIRISGPSAFGQSGCLEGPTLEAHIKGYPVCAGWNESKAHYRDAVAHGVSKCFADWQSMVTVPGLLWYPTFAAFAGVQAPPTANAPSVLSACVSSKASQIVHATAMKREMIAFFERRFPKSENRYDGFFDAVATVLSLGFLAWLSSQQVMHVLGQGPVPSGNGPVVGGMVVNSPGHLLS